MNDQRKAWGQKKFHKTTDIHFSIFIENGNWDLKFVFRFDNENKKLQKIKILYHFTTKIECTFRSTDFWKMHDFSILN